MKLKILLLVILLVLVPQASATFFINQTSSTSSKTISNLGVTWINQSFTTPNYDNFSVLNLDYIEIYAIGSNAIMYISNDTWNSSPITFNVGGVLGVYRANFSDVHLNKNSQYYYNVSTTGATSIFYDNTNPYSGGRAFSADGALIATDDFRFNISLSPHDNVGSWAMNQGSGNYANDTSGFNNNGTIWNITTGAASWSTNLINGSVNSTALRFDGVSGNVSIPTNTTLNFSSNAFSFGMWMLSYPNSEIDGRLFSKRSGATGYEADLVTATRKLEFYTTSNLLVSTSSLPNSTFSYVTFVLNGNTKQIYINGVLDSTQTLTPSSTDNENALFFGKYGDGNIRFFNGVLDEVKAWNYGLNQSEITTEYQRFQPVPAYPVGNITLSATTIPNTVDVPFSWHDTVAPLDYIDVATDSGFTSIVSSQVTSADSTTITLAAGNPYYWRIRQYFPATGTFGNTSATQIFQTAQFAGFINVNVVDELTFLPVYFFNATLYNGTVISKSSGANAYVNFTSSDVIAGQYQLVVTPNSSYAERAIIVNSPGNYTVYLPSTLKTVDFVAFYLLDYTGRFPYANSNLTITKGVNITHSQFFDSDAKVATNLIRGERYTITIYNPSTNDLQQWGDYSSAGTGSVQVVISSFGVNTSILKPYAQTITNINNSEIEFSWIDNNNVLVWVNMTIYKNNQSTIVYSLNTTSKQGTATYTITDTNATYYATMNARTTLSDTINNLIINLTTIPDLIRTPRFGSFVLPSWFLNALAIVLMFMLGGSFGAMHRGEGAVVTGLFGVYFLWIGWLTMTQAIAALFGSMVLLAILYHLSSKAKGGYF